jgi:hypothetical protein
VVAWFRAASVTEADSEHHKNEGERVEMLGECGQDEHQQEAQSREDAVDDTEEADPTIR